MRIDREAFLLAVSALAGCERAEPSQSSLSASAHTAPAEAPRPAASVITRDVAPLQTRPSPAPTVEPVAAPVVDVTPPPPPAPPPKAATGRRPMSAAKRWFLGLSVEQRGNVKSLCEERIAHPCAAMLAMVRELPPGEKPPEDPEEKYLAAMSTEDRDRASTYCREQSKMPPPSCETPLVVAFDNQPVAFSAAGHHAFAFVPGEPAATDWPTAATPWIARDLDGNGAITSGTELFGSSTALAGGATARNGFQALAALDANADGTLDARDPAFVELVLWSDHDGDHRSTPDELRRLASVVTAIPLAPTLDARCDARDNCEGERGPLHWRDATGTRRTGTVVDVYIPRR